MATRTDIVTFRLSRDLKNSLNLAAGRGGLKTSEYVRRIVQKNLEKSDDVSMLLRAMTTLQKQQVRLEHREMMAIVMLETLVRFFLLTAPSMSSEEFSKASVHLKQRFEAYRAETLKAFESGGLIVEALNSAIDVAVAEALKEGSRGSKKGEGVANRDVRPRR